MMDGDRAGNLESFLSKYGVEVSRKRKRSLLETDERSYESYKAGISIAQGCKNMDLEGTYSVYRRCKDGNIHLSPGLYSNLLCLVAGFGDPGSGSSNRRLQVPHDFAKATDLYQDMRANGITPSEAAFSALIRCTCTDGSFEAALQLYDELKRAGHTPKLRTVSPLLAAVSEANEVDTCVQLFDEMKRKFDIEPSEKEYFYVLKVCARKNDLRFFTVFAEFAEHLLVIHNAETLALVQSHLTSEQFNFTAVETLVGANGQLQEESVSDIRLQSINIPVHTRDELLQKLEEFATNRDPEQRHKVNNKVRDLLQAAPAAQSADLTSVSPPVVATPSVSNAQRWMEFTSWLDGKYSAGSFDIIVDGANVGYYKQNFAGAPTHIDYHQVDAMLTALQAIGRRPLLIVHSRHLSDRMIPAASSSSVRAIIASWKERELMYATPKGYNDDWFWLYASVKYQVPLVSNDDLRDHHFQLLSPRYFVRWRERTRVCYDMFFVTSTTENPSTSAAGESEVTHDASFGSGIKQMDVHRSVARFYHPNKYSFRIQHINEPGAECYCLPPLVPLPAVEVLDPQATEDTEFREDCLLGRAAKLRQDTQVGLAHADYGKSWKILIRRTESCS